jgi:hypothetical protein
VSTRTYGVVTPDVLTSYDGLGFLKAIINGTVPNPPISELIGFHLVEVEEGRAVFEGVPEFHHYNPIGTVHAGFAATLLDSALGCAIFSTIKKATPGLPSSSNSIWCVQSAKTLARCERKAALCIEAGRSRLLRAT